MKKRIIAGLSLSTILAVSLAVFLSNTEKEAKKVKGYSVSSLPTTIDLNDTSASNIRSYYSSLNNLAQNQRKGENLLKNLKEILKNGQKYYSYDSGNAIWQIYEIADRDWAKSPASSTTYGTYNSSTNKITGYTYGTSSSSSKNNPYIHALYINRDVTNQTTAWDNHNQDQWGINREHVWPKAEGFETSGAGGARGDPFHLMAGNGYANNIHSNYYYGYVKTSSSYTDCGTKYSNQSGNLRGSPVNANSGTVFEPQDSDKGDIARAIFYMVARYNYLSGSDSDGIDSNNPNLTLTNDITTWASSGFSSTTSTTGKMGILTDLLAWHHADPVDEYEIHRNNLLFTNYTNNRNPFIDFPEWADFIWGSVVYNGKTKVSYSSTPTGYATPSSDTINGYNGGSTDPVSVTGVSLDKETTTIVEGNSELLTAYVSPYNATDQSITWSSSDETVATVSINGRVNAIAEGTTTITATTTDGGFTASCVVTVTPAGSATEGTETGTIAAASGALSGWTASGTGSAYADGSVKFDSAGDNVYSTSLFFSEVSSGMQTLDVTINGKINGTPTSTNSYKVEALDSSGNVLASETKTGADVFTTSYGDVTFSMNSNLNGCVGIKITYVTKGGGNWGIKSVSWSATYVTSQEITLSSIAVKTAPTKVNYSVGDDFDPTGLVITLTFSDESTEDLPYDDNEDLFEFSPETNLQTSNTSVTITYGGKIATQAITVTSKTLSSIAVKTAPTKIVYFETECFDPTGLVIAATYSDSSTEDISYVSGSTAFTFNPSNSTALATTNNSVTITYNGKSTTQPITVNENLITATVTKSYSVGDAIVKNDITVRDSLNNRITSFTFSDNNYQFKYSDAASGGALTNKTFAESITANGKTCSVTVQVRRNPRVNAETTTDTLTRDLIGVTGTSYENWSGKTSNSEAVYSGNTSGKNTYTNPETLSIQLRSNYSSSGIISTTSGGTLTSVSVVFNSSTAEGRTLNIYGKTSPYSSPSDLYSDSTKGTLLGTIVMGTSTSLSINGNYTYIGIRSSQNAIYLDSITITYGAGDSAVNVANYIMFEDTNNQCATKTTVAISYFNALSADERSTFMTSTDYVISTARERFNAWLAHEGKTIISSNNDYVIQNRSAYIKLIGDSQETSNTMLIIVVSILVGLSFVGYMFIRKNKEN